MDISVCGATFVGIFSLLSHNSFYRIHLQCFTLVMTMAVVVLMVIHFAMCCIFAIFAFSFLPFLFADFFLGRHFTLIPKSCKSSFSFFCVLAFFSFSVYVFLLLVLIYISFSAFWHNRVRCFYKVEKKSSHSY